MRGRGTYWEPGWTLFESCVPAAFALAVGVPMAGEFGSAGDDMLLSVLGVESRCQRGQVSLSGRGLNLCFFACNLAVKSRGPAAESGKGGIGRTG